MNHLDVDVKGETDVARRHAIHTAYNGKSTTANTSVSNQYISRSINETVDVVHSSLAMD
jgi:hypothetical protein